MPPSRRTVVGTIGAALLPVTGCLGRATTDPPTLRMGETYETDNGRSIRVENPAVHPSVVTVEYVASTHLYERVTDAGAGQFVSFTVAVAGWDLPAPKRKDVADPIDVPLAVVIDGARHGNPIPVGRDDHPDVDRVAIRVPVKKTTDAAVIWARDGGPTPRWRLPEAIQGRLTAAPDFEVRSFSVPDEVQSGETFDATVDVENVGDREGRFLASLGAKQGSLGLSELFRMIPEDSSTTVSQAISPHYSEGMESVRVVLDWGANRLERIVKVDGGGSDGETPSATE